ncbi:MAG TPA: hypothetical protein VGC87_01510 [Pyrinomonadaceae bacterium]|jgi:chromosome segregation ATPase
MIYLSHELGLLQAEAQRYDALAAQANASAAQQEQVASAARSRATAARAEAARMNGVAANLQAQAAASDAQAANLDQQIVEHRALQPERVIENPDPRGKPPFIPNPEWAVWNDTLSSLKAQRDQARDAAAAARTAASQNSAAATQQQASAALADNDAANATAAAAPLRQQAAQASAQRDAVTQMMTVITRWQQELARQPFDRGALETTERELTARVEQLDSQYAAALDASAAADRRQWYLQTLTQELNAKINNLNAQLAQTATEETSAAAAMTDLQRRITNVMRRRPE